MPTIDPAFRYVWLIWASVFLLPWIALFLSRPAMRRPMLWSSELTAPFVLYPLVLSPEVAAMSMSGSTLIVAINALMLKRTKLAGIRQPARNVAPGKPDMAAIPMPQSNRDAVAAAPPRPMTN